MSPYLIEICCTGNNGRSPMAEVVGNHYLQTCNLEDRICFISSGTEADARFDALWPLSKVAFVLSKASTAGLIPSGDLDAARYERDKSYRGLVQHHAIKALRMMRSIEGALRDAALCHVGLEYTGQRTQTMPRSDVSLVLGITSKHADQARIIYSTRQQPPPAVQVGDYAGVQEEVPDCLGSLRTETYIGARQQLERILPTVVEKLRGDLHV